MAGFKDLLESLPELGELWTKTDFVDPLTGLSISKLAHESALVGSKFFSAVIIQTSNGPVTLSFGIDASTIDEARMRWRGTAQKAVADYDVQLREQQRRIVLPSPPMRHGVPHG